jgi:hypothetical protein
LNLLLLLPFVLESDHLIVGSHVVPAAATELRHFAEEKKITNSEREAVAIL